jgi:DNA-binding Lrp family transcriptional regulator
MKNSRRCDRELAKAIGVSQPTTTRLRTKLEKEGYIKEYTVIPNFSKIGYTIMALNFFKLEPKLTKNEIEGFRKTHPRNNRQRPVRGCPNPAWNGLRIRRSNSFTSSELRLLRRVQELCKTCHGCKHNRNEYVLSQS